MIGVTKFSRFIVNTLINQLIYLFSFLGIMLIIFTFVTFSDIYHGDQSEIYYSIAITIIALPMLAIGLSTALSIRDVVENGITRKDYFKGTLISACIIAVLLPIMTLVISIISETIFVNVSDIQFKLVEQNIFNYAGAGTDAFSDTFFTVFSTAYIDPQVNLLLSLITASLNGFMFYLLGWLFGIILYRSKSSFNAGSLFGILSLIIAGTWNMSLSLLLEPTVSNRILLFTDVPNFLIIISLGAVLLLTIYLIRLLTRNIVIKI